jgi:ABC-type branched-subunit amino acid transport system substrate-binding protein
VTGETRGGTVDAVTSTRSITTRVRGGSVLAVVAVLALVASACSSSPKTTTSTTATTTATTATAGTTPPGEGTSPGVNSTSVTVGQVDDLTAPLPGLFKGAEDGTRAYFDYVNSTGGVNGRKIELDAQDSAYNDGTVANATTAQIKNDFALVGGFSLDDSAEEPLIKAAGMPDIAYPLDPDLSNLPTAYSPTPNTANDYPLTAFKVIKQKFPQDIKHMGILWANATASTASSEKAFERAAESQGFKIVYDAGFTPSQTTFLPNVLTMKSDGVKLFFTTQMPDSYSATLAEEMQQQDFKPVVIQGDAYSANLVKDGGAAVNGMYLDVGYVLYLGTDSDLPAAALFNKWMKIADPSANFELQSLYGWASAQLFVQALRNAGQNPTRASLLEALDKITSFDASGLLSPGGDPASNVPGQCFVLAQVVNGQIVRVPPTPKTGFICSPGGLLPAPGFKPEVRPAPSS